MATKKVGSAGRFGVKYGKKIREAVISIEKKQRQRQKCPYCAHMTAKRQAKGVWHCTFCGKTFAGGAYFLEAK
jgi:large subunit ribosomal protein L37Ae